MIKDKEQKKKFLDGLFDDFSLKSAFALLLMACIVLLSSIARLIVEMIGFKAIIALILFYCMCYLVVHKVD